MYVEKTSIGERESLGDREVMTKAPGPSFGEMQCEIEAQMSDSIKLLGDLEVRLFGTSDSLLGALKELEERPMVNCIGDRMRFYASELILINDSLRMICKYLLG